MLVGYVRVSTKKQNAQRQINSLEKYGCEEIFIDHESGKDFNRKEYIRMKKFLRKKDVLVFGELDRLGRNKQEIDREWQELIDKGVDIVVLDVPILDTRKYQDGLEKLIMGLTRDIFSYLAEKERENILERQKQGIEIAKREGKFKGRPVKYSANAIGKDKVIYEKIVELLKEKKSIQDISKDIGVSRNTVYKIKKQISQK
ncbi:recombinase family protein [Planococcus sp. SE5232]|uniref:recombinase family protein n=1 Tax=unclassified Planococcus (in: firmicutes) TaxID=2662419 RepID=UPI003D6A9B99